MSSTEDDTASGITVDVDHNPYLAEGSGTVDAIVSVTIGRDVADADVTLRLWIPVGARVAFVKQVAPTIEDLTHRRVATGAQTSEYPLGSWAAEDRDYHIQVEVAPLAVGREKLAARVNVVAGEQVLGEGLVTAVWTDDTAKSAQLNRRVAHYTGQAALAQAIHEGLTARHEGDVATATAKFQRALELVIESGNDETAKRLDRFIVIDGHAGTARLRGGVTAADEMALDALSTKTARVRKEA